ncbi:hypothetical protein [Phocaeicola faecicola]|jgi:hypothetical protein|nr:hypothetical protein [Phocaeicola faecicola]MDD6907755.1 hypothetical protein [Bacteroidaceae bacterium]MDY4602034.1 hypothetical protein [Bacteroides uniformis]MDY4872948.1 hypothetical protein [Phocaeicola faecicola]
MMKIYNTKRTSKGIGKDMMQFIPLVRRRNGRRGEGEGIRRGT